MEKVVKRIEPIRHKVLKEMRPKTDVYKRQRYTRSFMDCFQKGIMTRKSALHGSCATLLDILILLASTWQRSLIPSSV